MKTNFYQVTNEHDLGTLAADSQRTSEVPTTQTAQVLFRLFFKKIFLNFNQHMAACRNLGVRPTIIRYDNVFQDVSAHALRFPFLFAHIENKMYTSQMHGCLYSLQLILQTVAK